MTAALNGPSRANLVELVERLANAGRDDPTIAHRLDITPSQVARLRREFDIPAGEQRWIPLRSRGGAGQ